MSFYPTDVSDYQSATHYSYDIHGNVKRLVQEIPNLNLFGRQFTTLDYEYDLISGNVNRVWYQKGKLEQFSHRYRYDADNRITHVYTSNLFKKNDTTFLQQERLEARYLYLPTGALSRVELGHKQIQGIDYAYTLQGWLKDINGYRGLLSDVYDLLSGYDTGNDGSPVTGNLNSVFPWDAFSSSIQYYQGDYQPVVGTNYFNCPSTSAVPLYNGNISALTTSYHNSTNVVLMKLFRYDKLNRIKQMQTAEQFQSTSGWEPVSDNYSTEYEYDWNGNLLSLRRNDKYGQIMHDIAYHYPNAANNRLGSITATGLNSSSYRYDAIGNLVRDNAEGLTVSWNALGKVDSICRNGLLLSRFRYSPTGQRQVKMADGDTVFYIHDATGNVMCVYQLKNDTLSATERYMYGSKRLGMLGQQVWIVAGGTAGMSDSSTIGARTYELTDHLGNVTATILDRKRPVLNSYGNMVYIPLIVSYTDYYPFGYPISDRSYYFGGYRYFFNGQEADNEVFGDGVSLTAEFWQYDTRLGRRWNVDPKYTPMLSSYSCFVNSPLSLNDKKGDTTYRFNINTGEYLGMYDLNQTGQYGSYGYTETAGYGENKYEYWKGETFNFADLVNDAKDIRDGIITQLVFVRDEEMVSILRNQGAFEVGKLGFVKESTGGGDFDYSFSILPNYYPEANFNPVTMKSNFLFLPEGDYTAHNFMNFGNYLWGMTGAVVGFSYAILQAGAHANSLLNSNKNGYESQLDSKDDQLSIKKGIFHSNNKNYRQYRRKK